MDTRPPRRWGPTTKSSEERRAIRRRRAEASWYAWALEEFVRYAFGFGVFAAAVFVPLQMQESWVPRGLPARLPSGLVALLAVIVDGAAVFLAWRAYLYLWGTDGWIHRAVARREGTRPGSEDDQERA